LEADSGSLLSQRTNPTTAQTRIERKTQVFIGFLSTHSCCLTCHSCCLLPILVLPSVKPTINKKSKTLYYTHLQHYPNSIKSILLFYMMANFCKQKIYQSAVYVIFCCFKTLYRIKSGKLKVRCFTYNSQL